MADNDLAHLVHQKWYGERALQARTIHNKAYQFFSGGANCSQIKGVRLCESQARNQVSDSTCDGPLFIWEVSWGALDQQA
jgi:hypothetical protein